MKDKLSKFISYSFIAVFFSIAFSGCDYSSEDSASTNTNTQTESVTQTGPTSATRNIPSYNPPTFHGNTCTGDCSGHEAGYDWAEEKGITDPDDCGGNSTSFIEGCESYAQEQEDASSYDDYDDEGYDY